jgi:hypothetical protein
MVLLLSSTPLPAYEQPLIPADGPWSFGNSELSRGYWRAERVQLPAPATVLAFSVLQLTRPGGGGAWQPCAEDPQPLELRIHAVDGLHPGPLLESRQLLAQATLEDTRYGNGWPTLRLEIPLDPPLEAGSVWLALSGSGDPDCMLLWGAGSGGDGFSRVDRGLGWELVPYDLNLELSTPTCEAPQQLALQWFGSWISLQWAAVPEAVDYRVEQAPEMIGPWTVLGHSQGATRWNLLGGTEERRFFRVVSICP